MNELLAFLSQPLAMTLESAQSLVSVAAGRGETKKIESPPPCLLNGSERLGMDALDTVASGSKLVAVVPLWGPLSMHGGWFSTSTRAFAQALQRVDASPQIGTVVIPIDSPGGTVTGTQEAADALRGIRERGDTKTIAVVDPMMASAASWIGTAADEVVMTPSGDAGSIGVISVYQDVSKALEQMGVTFNIARTPDKKARFSGVEPMTDEMRGDMEARNAEAYDDFLAAMAKNRGVSKSQAASKFGGGELLNANEAREAGLVDRIATMDEVLAGLSKPGAKRGSRRSAAAARLRLAEA